MDAEQEVGARAVAGDDQQQACRRLVGEVEDSRALTAHAILQQPLGVDGVARQQALQGHRMRRQRMRLRPVDARFDTPAQRHMPFQQLAQGLSPDGVGRGADYAQVGQQVVGGVLRRQLLGHPQAPFGEAQPGGAGARLRLVALGRGLAQQFQQGLGGRRATGERLQRYASGQSLAQRREQVHRPQGIAAGGVEALSGARRRTSCACQAWCSACSSGSLGSACGSAPLAWGRGRALRSILPLSVLGSSARTTNADGNM